MRCSLLTSSLLLLSVTLLSLAILPFAGASGPGISKTPVQHVVVLMMENRAFDHLLGFLRLEGLDGLLGNETNSYNTSDPNSPKVMVNKNGFDTGPDDPGHSFEETAEEIFGKPGVVNPTAHDTALMGGFAQNAVRLGHNPLNPLSMFTDAVDSAPIINTLAKEFVVFDKWFCSIPGPTDPNRAFAMSGTSEGLVTNFNGTLWGQQSYFDYLRQANHTFRAYYQDDPWAVMYFKDMHQPENAAHVAELPQFFKDLEKGDLPEFTWLQPRMTSTKGLPTWQHPDASVREGERLIKEVYEALRASSLWESSALLITYDEHGGFYDHVPPPSTGVPNPNPGSASSTNTPTAAATDGSGFAFDRLGIRIPTILVSPWVGKGVVEHEPKGPTATSQYDGTSTIATVNELLGLAPMTARDAWAGSFARLLTSDALPEPRSDCPTKLPELPAAAPNALEVQRSKPLNDHLELQVGWYCSLGGHSDEDCARAGVNQGAASDFIVREASRLMQRVNGAAATAGSVA